LTNGLGQNVDTIISAFGGKWLFHAFIELWHSAADFFQVTRLPSPKYVSVALSILHDCSLDAIITQEEGGLLTAAGQSKYRIREFGQLMAWATLNLQ
jgi:hypothetical protein